MLGETSLRSIWHRPQAYRHASARLRVGLTDPGIPVHRSCRCRMAVARVGAADDDDFTAAAIDGIELLERENANARLPVQGIAHDLFLFEWLMLGPASAARHVLYVPQSLRADCDADHSANSWPASRLDADGGLARRRIRSHYAILS